MFAIKGEEVKNGRRADDDQAARSKTKDCLLFAVLKSYRATVVGEEGMSYVMQESCHHHSTSVHHKPADNNNQVHILGYVLVLPTKGGAPQEASV